MASDTSDKRGGERREYRTDAEVVRRAFEGGMFDDLDPRRRLVRSVEPIKERRAKSEEGARRLLSLLGEPRLTNERASALARSLLTVEGRRRRSDGRSEQGWKAAIACAASSRGALLRWLRLGLLPGEAAK